MIILNTGRKAERTTNHRDEIRFGRGQFNPWRLVRCNLEIVAWTGKSEIMFFFHPRETVAPRGFHLFFNDKLTAVLGHLKRKRIFAVTIERGLADRNVESKIPSETSVLWHSQGQGLDRLVRAFEVSGKFEPDPHLLDPRRVDHPHLVPITARVSSLDAVAEITGG